MYYYTYEIYIDNPESNLHGCYYYGKHETKNLSDNYFGSGKLIRRYINKYGTETLIKTILNFYASREELLGAEKALVDEKFSELGRRCLNLHEGGSGGHWVEYCSEEEYQWRVERVRQGLLKHTTPEQRSANAKKAGLSKRNVSLERRAQWTANYKKAFREMSEESKKEKYTKVSSSLKDFYRNPANIDIVNQMKAANKATNIVTAKKWRGEFYDLFGCTPESFRSSGNMKSAIDLYKRIKDVCKEQQEYEISRFMESISLTRKQHH